VVIQGLYDMVWVPRQVSVVCFHVTESLLDGVEVHSDSVYVGGDYAL